MKVFILTTVMAPYRVQLFSELGKQCELYVCFEQVRDFKRDEKWYDESSKNFNIIKLRKWNDSISTIKFEVIKHVCSIHPDIIIAYEYHTNTSLLLLSYCLTKKIPYIINIDGAFVTKSIKDFVKRFYISKASGFISSGKMADDYLLHYGAIQNRIHHNHFTSLHSEDILNNLPSIEEKKIAKQEKGIFEKRVILSIGQFIYRKGYDVLLNAAASFGDDIGVYIIGGRIIPEYRELLNNLKLSNVHFIDFMSPAELKNYFIAADVFVLPTREDVWGLVINEAMAHGLPVVTTERCVAGIELINDGVNGYVVPIENHELLYQAVNKIMSNEVLRNNMAVNNLHDIREYTYEVSARDIMSAIIAVYESAVGILKK